MNAPASDDRDHAGHGDESAMNPLEETARSLGRRAADHDVYDVVRREYEERMRSQEQARLQEAAAARERRVKWIVTIVAGLAPFAGTFFGIWLSGRADIGYTEQTPNARIAALERSVRDLSARMDTTHMQGRALLMIRCLDTATDQRIVRAAGVDCDRLTATIGTYRPMRGAAHRGTADDTLRGPFRTALLDAAPTLGTGDTPSMPPRPVRPVHQIDDAVLPGKRWPSWLALLRQRDGFHDPHGPDPFDPHPPYPEV